MVIALEDILLRIPEHFSCIQERAWWTPPATPRAPAAAPTFGAVQSPAQQQQQQSAFSIGAGGQNRTSGTRRIATARRTRK